MITKSIKLFKNKDNIFMSTDVGKVSKTTHQRTKHK